MMAEQHRLQAGLGLVLRAVESTPKGEFVTTRALELHRSLQELMSPLDEAEQRTWEELPSEHSWLSSELKPEYEFGEFAITEFSSKRESGAVLFSEAMHSHTGVSWRLKVYPNGNGVALGVYLSVFLELLTSPLQRVPSKYEYRIEMGQRAGHSGAPELVAREFASEFQEGECWGYNRFARVDHLLQDGYIDADDTLTLRYAVRRCSLREHCSDQQEFIAQLQHKLQVLLTELQLYRSPDSGSEPPDTCPEPLQLPSQHVLDKDGAQPQPGALPAQQKHANCSLVEPCLEQQPGEASVPQEVGAALASLQELSLTLESADQSISNQQLLEILQAATRAEREIMRSTGELEETEVTQNFSGDGG